MDTLILLAGPVGSGIAASLLFTLLRQRCPAPTQEPTEPWRTLYWLLWAPKGARITSMALAALIMIGATVVITAYQGGDVARAAFDAIDRAIAASGISQLAHVPQLSGATKTTPEA